MDAMSWCIQKSVWWLYNTVQYSTALPQFRRRRRRRRSPAGPDIEWEAAERAVSRWAPLLTSALLLPVVRWGAPLPAGALERHTFPHRFNSYTIAAFRFLKSLFSRHLLQVDSATVVAKENISQRYSRDLIIETDFFYGKAIDFG